MQSIGPTPRQLLWDPQPDITTHELAICLRFLFVPEHRRDMFVESFYKSLPPECQRHFREV